jgi:hypothetical protein
LNHTFLVYYKNIYSKKLRFLTKNKLKINFYINAYSYIKCGKSITTNSFHTPHWFHSAQCHNNFTLHIANIQAQGYEAHPPTREKVFTFKVSSDCQIIIDVFSYFKPKI